MLDFIYKLFIYATPVLLAITLHEAAHAYVAYKLGDNTARVLGRVSLNPIRHIDPIGTILIPAVLLFWTEGKMVFGYAKPVPVRAGNFTQPLRDMALVAVAGPLSNLAQALLWLLLLRLFGTAGSEFFMHLTIAGIKINLVLFAFNLLPIPPLDGGRILTWLLPSQAAHTLAQMEKYGFFVVIALMGLGVLNQWWLKPIVNGTWYGLNAILAVVGLGGT